MPRVARELSALDVKRLQHPGSGINATFAVGGVSGLLLQVTPNGGRTWLLRVAVGGKRREIGLGGFPDVTLSMARERAREAKDKIRQGVDPVEERRAVRAALVAARGRGLTFTEAVERYLAAKLDAFKNPKHRQQWRNTLVTYALPELGGMRVQDIAVQDVLRVLEPIWRDKTETASRLREREGIGSRCLEFAALTAARSQEVRGARWDEIDLAAAMWTVPAQRMKMDREHRVPLSGAAVALLQALPRFQGNPLVFAAPRGGELSDATLSATMKRLHTADMAGGGAGFIDRVSKRPAVPHGLRSTFRDWVGERTHFPGDMAKVALAHRIGNAVEASYRRGDMVEKRRGMMGEWAGFLTAQDSNTCALEVR